MNGFVTPIYPPSCTADSFEMTVDSTDIVWSADGGVQTDAGQPMPQRAVFQRSAGGGTSFNSPSLLITVQVVP